MKCIVCDSDSHEVLFKAGQVQPKEVLRCRQCSLMFLNTEGAGAPEAASGFEEGGSHGISRADLAKQYVEKQRRQIEDYKHILDFVGPKIGNGARVLEVGCNIGAFLDYLRQAGFQVAGIEPAPWWAKYGVEEYGLPIQVCDLAHAELNEGDHDLVLLLHVIEHMPDPNAELRIMHRTLRQGGYLVIETPTYDSLSFKVLRHRERSLRILDHLFFFTPKTLGQLLERNGFRVVKTQYVGRTLNVDRLIFDVGLVTSNARLSRILRGIATKTGLAKLRFRINIHDMQRIYAVKY